MDDSTDQNLETIADGSQIWALKKLEGSCSKFSQTWVKICGLFGGKLVIRQVLNVPKAIQDFKEGFQEVKVGFYLFVRI